MRKIFCSVIVIFIFAYFQAQSNLRFKNYTITSGLSQSSVNAIIQDNVGFLWICTQDGLNRFDGYTFKILNSSDIPNLKSDFFSCAFRAIDEKLWFGTEKSLLSYDPKRDAFEAFLVPENFGARRGILQIQEDASGNLLILLSNTKIIAFNRSTSQFETVKNGLQGEHWDCVSFIPKLGIFAFSKERGLVHKQNKSEHFLWIPDHFDQLGSVKKIIAFGKNKVLVVGQRKMYVVDVLSKKAEELYVHSDIWGKGVEITDAYLSNTPTLYITTASSGLCEILLNQHYEVLIVSHYQEDIFQKNTLLSNLSTAIYHDKQSNIWIGSERGLSVFDPNYSGILGFGPSANLEYGIPSSQVWSFAEGASSSHIYVGHSAGISKFSLLSRSFQHFLRYKDKNVFAGSDFSVLCLHRLEDNRFLVGCVDGLYEFSYNISRPELFEFNKISHNLDFYQDFDVVYKIFPLDENRFWIASKAGLSLLDLQNKNYLYYSGNFEPQAIKSFCKDKNGHYWGGTSSGEVINFKMNDLGQIEIRKASFNDELLQLTKGAINAIYNDKNGNIWLGTHGAGLIKVAAISNELTIYNVENGLPNNVVYGILEDMKNNLWLSTNKGLSRFTPSTNIFNSFTEKDGLMSDEFNSGAYFLSSSGEMFFGGIFGFNYFKPELLKATVQKNKIFLSELLIANELISPEKHERVLKSAIFFSNEIKLKYSDRNVLFRFATQDIANSDLIEYKYILEGNDNDYTYKGNDNSILFSYLSPGIYRLKIYAKSTSGIWSEEPLELRIEVLPPFWVTWWFRLLTIAVAGLAFFVIYRYRVEQQRRHMVRLEMKIMERTTEIRNQNKRIAAQNKEIELQKRAVEEKSNLLQVEKEKVEKLLLNILPEETVKELSEVGETRARAFDQVSVMFTDFVGFTTVAETIEPIDLIDRLDMFFSRFDEIIEKWNIEKIKTVGDAYLCAGGMPIRSRENPIRTVLAGLEIQQFMKKQEALDKTKGLNSWALRVGINTGEVVAGVIGKKRYAYDIWGATVNLAQRMEVNCNPGSVNISESTYRFIAPYFDCTERGKVMVKNSGLINMYFVDRIKPELSLDALGLEPNDKFWEVVRLHLYSSIDYIKSERFIHNLLEQKLDKNLHYHSIWHTKDVTAQVERIAISEGITDEGLFLLKTAASYHDAGFIQQYSDNEPIGIEMAKEHLPKFGYSSEQITQIESLIYATKVPHQPKNLLEQIICDADLDYLGRDDFWEISDKLFLELHEKGKIKDKRIWDNVQVKFFEQHCYFTQTAIRTRKAKKEKHFQQIKARLNSNSYGS